MSVRSRDIRQRSRTQGLALAGLADLRRFDWRTRLLPCPRHTCFE
jgi:hypothetical protein